MKHLEYYGLSEEPFSVMPLTQFFYHSDQHDRALEKLHHAVAGVKGLTVVIG